MLLPTNCQYAGYTPIPLNGCDTIACCRAHCPHWALHEHGELPLCRCPGEEIYRFTWHSSFDGEAVVRVGRQGEEITLRWVYRWFVEDRGPGTRLLAMRDWRRVQNAIARASFCSLGRENERFAFDGATLDCRRAAWGIGSTL